MKNLFLIILGIGTITSCSAQNQLPEGKIKGNRDSFKVHHAKYNFDKQGHVLIYSEKNKYNNGIPYGKNEMEMGPKDVHVDLVRVKAIISAVLHDKLTQLRKRHEKIGGNFVFDLNGNLSDIAFRIPENSIITITELETIDNKLRSEIKATFSGKAYLSHVAINSGFEDISF